MIPSVDAQEFLRGTYPALVHRPVEISQVFPNARCIQIQESRADPKLSIVDSFNWKIGIRIYINLLSWAQSDMRNERG